MNKSTIIGIAVASVLVVILAVASFGCSTTVDPGTIGVPVNWGQVQTYTYPEGFHFVSPFTDVHSMSIRTQTYDMGGAVAQRSQEENDSSHNNHPDNAVNILTSDQLAVVMEVSIQFHLNPRGALEVYRLFGENYADAVVHPIVRAAVRDAASEFTAIQLVDQRARLQSRMEELVREGLTSTLRGREIDPNAITIDNILLRNIDLPESLDASIAAVQQQQQHTARSQQALLTARAEADRARVEAEGASVSTLARARAEAEANRIIAASLDPRVLEARRIEAMRGILANEHTRLVMLPTGTTPMLNIAATGEVR